MGIKNNYDCLLKLKKRSHN